MEDFGVSRATVREALRVLQATGVVESRQGDPRGPIISPFSTWMPEKSMSQLARVDSVSRLELIQFRLLIEARSASRSRIALTNSVPSCALQARAAKVDPEQDARDALAETHDPADITDEMQRMQF